MEPSEYTRVEVVEREGAGPCFSLQSEPDEDGTGWVHEIPLQALADRMELFGLTTPEEALKVITEIARDPGTGDQIYESLHEAYGEVARAEAHALYAAGGGLTRQTVGAQTVLAVGLVSENKRERLEDARRSALDRLGLGPAGVAGLSTMGHDQEEQPLVLRPTPEVRDRICEIVRRHPQSVEEYRLLTALSFVGVDPRATEPE